MNKFWGTVGFVRDVETSPDVYEEVATERGYSCEVLKREKRWQPSGYVIDDNLTVENRISLLADPFALDAYEDIRYIVRGKSKWKVTSVEVAYPRLILSLGGVYHGTANQN